MSSEDKKSKRKTLLHFHVSAEEENMIKTKMEQTGIISMSAYLRKMAIDGYMIKLELPELSAPVIKCKKTPRKKCSFVAERRKKR